MWKEDEKLKKTIELKDFMSCVDLINKIAQIAEEQNHHPDLSIKNYNTLEIQIYTHDENAITKKDRKLAASIDELLEN